MVSCEQEWQPYRKPEIVPKGFALSVDFTRPMMPKAYIYKTLEKPLAKTSFEISISTAHDCSIALKRLTPVKYLANKKSMRFK